MVENVDMDVDCAQKMQRCHEYVEALEEERKKIHVFQRELPLCLELVTHAIEACRRELSGTSSDNMYGQSDCSDQTTSECAGTGPVFEEFLPIKRISSCGEDGEHESREPENDGDLKIANNTGNDTDKKKSDWLRSVQLWNQSPDPPSKEAAETTLVVEVKRNGGAFQPFQKEKKPLPKSNKQPVKTTSSPPAPTASSSTAETGGGKRVSEKVEEQQHQTQTHRKQRRCWSPELHRRFLNALQQLGGSNAATPKQIRELMKVDGLTNDEVKSHLQKYRLHKRRPATHGGGNPQQPQLVVVGGIWPLPQPPPPADATDGVNAAAQRSSPSPKRSEDRIISSRCSSLATSSSTRTTTTSSPVS
ncbi:PREDICTED: myb family transcription factor EFM-like [Tarenaya hassleriana]|uniref:myb family transcription factor EFM-like n=1 Tax=Tarenaya hassleriana TaxID=28532 RepID=UPI00053C44AD|nr:PREDICTED: myb family transcription factor EFM-like [Tarenaya hassleriana]